MLPAAPGHEIKRKPFAPKPGWWAVWKILVAGLIVVTASAAAQPALPDDDGGGLFITAGNGTGGLTTRTDHILVHDWSNVTPGELPLAPSTPRHPYYVSVDDLDFTYVVQRDFGFTGNGVFSGLIKCTTGTTTSPTSADMTVWLSNGDQRWLVGFVEFDLVCTDSMTFEAPLRLAGVAFQANETLRLTIRAEVLNPGGGPAPNLALVAGDAAHPTGLFAPWTDKPLLDELLVSREWNDEFIEREAFYYSTDAPSVTVRAAGQISRAEFELRIVDAVNEDLYYSTAVDASDEDAPRTFDRPATLAAGEGTRWRVEVDGFGFASGHLALSVTPILELPEELAPLPTNETGSPVANRTMQPPGENQPPDGEPANRGSPLPLAAALVAIAYAARQRR